MSKPIKHLLVNPESELKRGDLIWVDGDWAEIYAISEDDGIQTSRGSVCRADLYGDFMGPLNSQVEEVVEALNSLGLGNGNSNIDTHREGVIRTGMMAMLSGFFLETDFRALAKMETTGQVSGAHYAAMTELLMQLGIDTTTGKLQHYPIKPEGPVIEGPPLGSPGTHTEGFLSREDFEVNGDKVAMAFLTRAVKRFEGVDAPAMAYCGEEGAAVIIKNVNLNDFANTVRRWSEEADGKEAATFLEWASDKENDYNTCWVAQSSIHDDGAPFEWRITQKLYEDQLIYSLEKSSPELLEEDSIRIDDDALSVNHYSYLRDAQKAAQAAESSMIEDITQGVVP